jgi:hypothetical protein
MAHAACLQGQGVGDAGRLGRGMRARGGEGFVVAMGDSPGNFLLILIKRTHDQRLQWPVRHDQVLLAECFPSGVQQYH